MLKKLSYIAIVFYLLIVYGQNLLEFGSDLRINFYFIGMALSKSLIAFILFKSFKNIATSFYLFMCLSSIINQVYFDGGLSIVEIIGGFIGIIYVLLEKRIKKWL
jgi:hypothetical protein